MATLKTLEHWLVNFSSLAKPPLSELAIETLVTAYDVAFRGVEDKAFVYACEQYLQHGKFFPPKPFELQALVPKHGGETITQYNKDTGKEEGDYAIRVASRCSACHSTNVLCIQEPAVGGRLLCRKCYSGMTNAQYKKNMETLGMANAKEGQFVKYDSKTKTVSIVHVKPEGYDPLEDIIGGE